MSDTRTLGRQRYRLSIGGLWSGLDRWHLALIGAKAADSLTTIVALSLLSGFEEVNPLAAWAYGALGQVPGSALIFVASCMGLIASIEAASGLYRLLEGDAGVRGYAAVLRRLAYATAALAFGLLAVRNIWVILG